MIHRYARIALALALLALAPHAIALPTGPTVAAGTATFSTAGGTLTIANSNNAIINWQGFSIGAGETARFNQPSASSAVLNRVVTASPSSIFGSLTSNGNVFLVNPNGIVFGAGSQVSVGGLSVSTLDITDANFLAGNYTFAGGGSAGITLDGAIVAPAGLTANSGGAITSSGVLPASVIINTPANVTINTTGGTLSTNAATDGTLSISGINTPADVTTTGGVLSISGDVGGGGAISLTTGGGVTLRGGVIALTAVGGIASGGSGVTLTAAGIPAQSGGIVLSQSAAPVQGSAPSISVANLPALTGAVTVTSVSLNFNKREVAF